MGSYDASFSDPHIGQDDGRDAKEGARSDLDKALVILNQRSHFGIEGYVVERVGSIDDRAVGGDGNVVFENDPVMTNDVDVLLDGNIVTDFQLRKAVWIYGYGLEADAGTDVNVVADVNVFRLSQGYRTVEQARFAEAGEDPGVVNSGFNACSDRSKERDPFVEVLPAKLLKCTDLFAVSHCGFAPIRSMGWGCRPNSGRGE